MAAHQAMACCTPTSTVAGSRSYYSTSSPTASYSASGSCAAAAPPSAVSQANHNSSWLCLRRRLRAPGTGLSRRLMMKLPQSCRIPSPSPTTTTTSTSVRAVSAPDQECNEEECAPEKEVGKVSMEWKAEERTKVTGTYPPMSRNKWTGYVEKDTAGQTNIYSVEPTIYVSDNAISSGSAGDSSEGSQQTVLVAVGLALGLLVGAGVVLQRVSTTSNMVAAPEEALYAGPSLSFYIQKFKPTAAVVEASAGAPPPAAPATLLTPGDQPATADQFVPSISPAVPSEAPAALSISDLPELVQQVSEQASN